MNVGLLVSGPNFCVIAHGITGLFRCSWTACLECLGLHLKARSQAHRPKKPWTELGYVVAKRCPETPGTANTALKKQQTVLQHWSLVHTGGQSAKGLPEGVPGPPVS
jgi:hypothetical protein